jgi:hypothetical protein
MASGRLLSANCTTGWFDWSPGQLWLLPDGFLRLHVAKASYQERRAIQKKRRGIHKADAALTGAASGPAKRRRDKVAHPRDMRVEPDAPEFREFDNDEPQKLAVEDDGTLWISAPEIRAAKLHRGITTNSLKLDMHTGRRVKLLWLKRDLADDLILAALDSWQITV